MAALVGAPSVGLTTDIHSSALNPVGIRRFDVDGNEWIYLKGVASVADGTWVTFDEASVTTRAVANGQGRVAIAKAALVASTWGWFIIYGTTTALCLASFADNGKVYLTATDGSVDDADVAGDVVIGAVGRSARDTTTGMASFELDYPQVLDLAID